MKDYGLVRQYGVEIECLGLDEAQLARVASTAGVGSVPAVGYTHRYTDRWKVVRDGSLRDRGGEVVSPPLDGERGLAQIRAVCDALNATGTVYVDAGCGLHVHVDARGLDEEALRRVAQLWVRYEDTIDLFLPPARRASANPFCVSLVEALTQVRATEVEMRAAAANEAHLRLANGGNLRSLWDDRLGRNVKLNLCALGRHGTIEFRAHAGTTNPTAICHWVRFCVAFVASAAGARCVKKRRAYEQTPEQRFKLLFNAVIQGETRRYYARKMRSGRPGAPLTKAR